MVVKKVEDLSQSEESMFERNLALLASRGCQVFVTTVDGGDVEGYLAGLDKGFLQLCTADTGDLVLMNKHHIVSVTPTDMTLEDLAITDRLKFEKVNSKVKKFREVSSGYLGALKAGREGG